MRNATRDGSTAWKQFLFLFAAKQLSRTAFARLMTRNLGQCAEFAQWQVDNLTPRLQIVVNREDLWKRMIALLGDAPLVVWEFGVAWGYTTDWWLKRLRSSALVWRGFDRFTGLPRAWRSYPKGAFDAGGKVPKIDDPRVSWYVGDVEETLPKLDLRRDPSTRWVVLFDLDIYEPTAFAWAQLRKALLPGDLLYFDEAVDEDERKLLSEILGDSKIRVSYVASSPIGLVLKVEAAVHQTADQIDDLSGRP